MDELRPQDWIGTALEGFFAEHELPPGTRGALVAKMALACTGIQGEVEMEPFERLLGAARAIASPAERERPAKDALDSQIAERQRFEMECAGIMLASFSGPHVEETGGGCSAWAVPLEGTYQLLFTSEMCHWGNPLAPEWAIGVHHTEDSSLSPDNGGSGIDGLTLYQAVHIGRELLGAGPGPSGNYEAIQWEALRASEAKRRKLTPDEALAAGMTVDRSCYPWVAYRGERFNPTEWRYILTDLEAELRASLEAMVAWANPDGLDSGAPFDEAQAAIARARR